MRAKDGRLFQDPKPGASCEIAKFISEYPIHSKLAICHIRQANAGRVCLENTHPFIRNMWGQNWCFAHNGQLKTGKQLPLKNFRPVGTTDSEHIFCWMLDKIYAKFKGPPKNPKHLWEFIEGLCAQLDTKGVFNLLMSDSKVLFAHCSTKLVWLTRKAPFGKVHLVDKEVTVDFDALIDPKKVFTVLATSPLTKDEPWQKAEPGEFLVFKSGKRVRQF